MTVESASRTCPRCEATAAADAKFCANCGQALAEVTSADESRHARLSAAAPAPLITKMRAARLTGERKPVTALFVDVVGSTSLAEQTDPEDWTVIINDPIYLTEPMIRSSDFVWAPTQQVLTYPCLIVAELDGTEADVLLNTIDLGYSTMFSMSGSGARDALTPG